MALTIKMIKAPGGVPVTNKTHTFDWQGGTIGRGDGNDVVLADPDRFLSSQHCQIIAEGPALVIIDLSTNGTFVNGSPEPLGKGNRGLLKHGDRFEVGDYRFEVLADLAQEDVPGLDSSPFASPSFEEALWDKPTSESLGASPDVAGVGASLWDDFGAESEPLFTSQTQSKDPLAVFDDLYGSNISPAGTVDPLATYSDGSDSLNEAVAWPDVSGQALIPESWDNDFLVETTPAQRGRAGTGADEISPLNSPVALSSSYPDGLAESLAQPIVPPAPSPAASSKGAESVGGVASLVEAQAVQSDSPVSRAGQSALSSVNLDAVLLESMGLDLEGLTQERREEISAEVGLLMRELVSGLMQVLRSRSSIKNEFRMNVTTIQPVENNPLKFSADVDEAIHNMFVRRSNAYKSSIEAVREGFLEVGEHQLAMIAGIRHGFEQMMKRFDPEVLENSFDRQHGRPAIPGLKKGKYWASYDSYFKSLLDNMENSFQHLFGSDFVHAYEDQLRQLKAERGRLQASQSPSDKHNLP